MRMSMLKKDLILVIAMEQDLLFHGTRCLLYTLFSFRSHKKSIFHKYLVFADQKDVR